MLDVIAVDARGIGAALIDRDGCGKRVVPDGTSEKPLCRNPIALSSEQEVDGVARFIDRAIKILPLDNLLKPGVLSAGFDSVQHAVQTLAKQLQATEKLDAIVIFGDDQHEQFDDRNMPAISIYHGNDVPVSEPNCFACTGIDRGSGFEQIDEAPEYRHRQGPQARRS